MKIVSVASVGICEYCGIIFSIQDMPQECLDAVWLCFACGGKLTNESLGYNRNGKRTKWVGPAGKWVDREPDKGFKLGNFDVATTDETRLIMTSRFLR